ncbi:MAG: helix-turn-helix transcriptional regulator [Anaerolineales bacterium]|nr:helix-turn-helix transcriptional regulator [Anaerolineales bacterium]
MDDRLLVLQMSAWMEEHLTDADSGRELAAVMGYSENRLRQKFYNVTGETPSGYLRKRRLTEAARALMAGERIVDAALRFGYSSQDNFTTAFKAWFGITPGELQTMDRKQRLFIARMKEPLNIMELKNLKQNDLCTTLMGCMKGASDFYDLDWTNAQLFGYSTHAFMINIHKDLCPSSPYAWKKDSLWLAMRNMGIRKAGTVSLKKGSPAAERAEAEMKLRAHLDAGKLCVLDFLEHQLISGYDTQGFIFLQPWQGGSTVELPSLTFGSWKEAFEREDWIMFTLLEKDDLRADEPALLRSALAVAIRMRTSPEEFQIPYYQSGDGAWEWWLAGIERGLGASHGHWWSGMVWKECRNLASGFFDGLAGSMKPGKPADLCRELSGLYRECGSQLDIAKDKDAPAEKQKAALTKGRELDRRCADAMKDLLAAVV